VCGRYSLTKADEKNLKKRFNLKKIPKGLKPRYNISPQQQVPVILNKSPETLNLLRWGLIPFWAKEERIGYKMINARAETIMEKPSFKRPFAKQRCLVIADSFYEWKKVEKGSKQPCRVMMKDDGLFALAGIWDCWKKGEEDILSFSIITTSPNRLMKSIHDRMPVIIPQSQEKLWLSDIDEKEAFGMLKPYSAEKMKAYEISTFVNSPQNDSSDVIDPLT